MAYKYLAGMALTTKELTSSQIMIQLEAMGWTLHSDQSALFYKVYKSNGESGTGQYLYVKVTWSATNVCVDVCGFWGATSTTAPIAGVTAGIVPNSILWMYGNKDFMIIMQETTGTIALACAFYRVTSLPASAVNTITTGGILAGLAVTIPLTSIAGFIAGAKYQIYDGTTGYRQSFTCSSVAATSIVADSISTVGYPAGSVVGTHPFPVVIAPNSITPIYTLNGHRSTYNLAVTSGGSIIATDPNNSPLYLANSLPYLGTLTKRGVYPMTCVEVVYGPTTYNFLGTIEDGNGYIYMVPVINNVTYGNDTYTAAVFDAIYMGQLLIGTSSGGNSVSTLADTSKTWITDQWINKVLITTSGTEVGQIRKIVSNTATVLTVSPNFTTIPDVCNYAIAERGYRYILNSQGFLLREGV